MITLRLQAGSRAPEEILVPTLLASACGVVVAVIVARLLSRASPAPTAR
jgi:spore maturation protein SpmA